MNKFKFLDKNDISKLPKTSGVYAFFTRRSLGEGRKKGKQILYVGKATNIKERVKNHKKLLSQAEKIGYIKTDSEIEALILEASLIKKYRPKYNVAWKDDKNYFFVAVTKEKFPGILITHQTKQKNKYLGPFVDGSSLKQVLIILRKVFPFRTCTTLPKKPCLWHQLNLCPAPCLTKTKNLCQKNANNILKILQGRKNQVLNNLKKEMKIASKEQNYEKAAKTRDKIVYLERIMRNARIFEPNKADSTLQSILKAEKPISRIEAYDISNIQGQEATGSMVTFIQGKPNKSFYRKFKIKLQAKPNDVAMIKEVLSRRLKHKEWPCPDLILIDGGIAQLNTAIKMKNEINKNIKAVSLAKKQNKLFIEGRKKPILLKTLPKEIFNLVLHLRDEAHRFAITYHRKLRTKALLPR
ncbi:MAG: UvrB/UvrC motif-containing protein [Candidatus Pacebacteria bacterium]|nr:UvrB/UvrC motif-containing protein [Candidatus Paceibacterota bacterium]